MIRCQCVERHVPLPQNFYQLQVDGEKVELCPTTYHNVNELLTEFRVRGTIPPGRVTKHYSKYVREIALALWKESEKMA